MKIHEKYLEDFTDLQNKQCLLAFINQHITNVKFKLRDNQ